MQQSLISILTPFKNSSSFNTPYLEYIIKQTYAYWVLLIVDDHSTDESYNLVASFAQRDHRIKLLKTNGHGIIDALRLALKKSSGHYITRMDSDDLMAPNKLELMLHDLKTHGNGHIALGLVSYF